MIKISKPFLIRVMDYHEFDQIKGTLNEIQSLQPKMKSAKKIKFEEVEGGYGYWAIFFFQKDAEYERLKKETKEKFAADID